MKSRKKKAVTIEVRRLYGRHIVATSLSLASYFPGPLGVLPIALRFHNSQERS